MAYMHESVHICHLSSPFFERLTNTKRYPGQIFSGAVAIAPMFVNVLNFLDGNAPRMETDE